MQRWRALLFLLFFTAVAAFLASKMSFTSLRARATDMPYSDTKSVEVALGSSILQTASPTADVPFEISDKSLPFAPAQVSAVAMNAVSVERIKDELRNFKNSELKVIVSKCEYQLKKHRLVDRANRGMLSMTEAETLARFANRKAAAQILLVERLLASAESRRTWNR
jgi:hypothetical protein